MAASPAARRCLCIILLTALALRVWLAFSGGEYFWPDESRYNVSRAAVMFMRHGQWREAGTQLLGHADHLLFRWFGLIPAGIESFVGRDLTPWTASYFGLFSVAGLWLVWAIARRAGAAEGEALWATFLAAGSTSLLYYSRHLLPYDVALCFMLAAFWQALAPWSWRRSFATGILVGIGFLTYNGYWLLGGTVLILHVLLGAGGRRRFVGRALGAAAGLALSLGMVIGAAALLGHNLVADAREFAGTINQGDFYIGYRLIPAYLWWAEGGMLVLWLAGVGYALGSVRSEGWDGRMSWYIGALALVGGGLILFSDVVPKFIIYGRLIRVLVPFLCLAAADGFTRFVAARAAHRGLWAGALAVVAGGFAIWNFSVPLGQVFPVQFRQMAAAAAARQEGFHAYRLTFAQSLWNLYLGTPLPGARPIVRRSHPMQFRPYQYEGDNVAQRADIARHNVAMRFTAAPGRLAPDPAWRGYPGPVRFVVQFPRSAPGVAEPLVASGEPGRGDIFYVRYVDGAHVVFGLDHWGGGATESAPVAADYSQPHEIAIFAGFLLPPALAGDLPDSTVARSHDQLLAMLDGHLVFSLATPFYPTRPGEISFGVNFIGGSVPPSFSGQIVDFGSPSAEQAQSAMAAMTASQPTAGLVRQRPDGWHGSIGPVRLRLTLPAVVSAGPEPLLSVGKLGTGALFFMVQEDRGQVRLGYRALGQTAILSAPMPLGPGGVQTVDLSAGSLMPEDDTVVYASDAYLGALRDLLFIRWNGRVALRLRGDFPTIAGPVAFGANFMDDVSSRPYFQGRLLSVEALPGDAIPALHDLREVAPNPGPGWEGYPGPVELSVIFPLQGRGAEPLLVSGVTGAADFLYVRYDDARHVRIGIDHWGSGGPLSAPIPIEPGTVQKVRISMGSLFPPVSSALYQADPSLLDLRRQLSVSVNGRLLLQTTTECQPARLDQVFFGSNPVGGSTCVPCFGGRMVSVVRTTLSGLSRRP